MAMTSEQDTMLKQLHTAIVGDETLGHTGLVKRMKNVEGIVESHDPVIKAYMTQNDDKIEYRKKIKFLVIAGAITFITGLAIQLIILFNQK